MAKRVSSPKPSSGEGFQFEDAVVAHYLVLMLLQKPAFTAEYGHIVRLDFQTETLGWCLDDLLITLKSPSGVRRIAISLKSNTQFTSKAAPPDFTRAVWEQFLKTLPPNPQFDIDRDFLGLVTAPHGSRVSTAVRGLLGNARAQHPADLTGRLGQPGYAKSQGSLLESFKCPTNLSGEKAFTDEDTVRLVASIYFEEFDFLDVPSKDCRMAVEYCRMALRSEAPDDAETLWDHLVAIAKAARPKNGYYDLPKLARQLRDSHELKSFPRYAADWNAIDEWTRKRLSAIPEHIGRTISLPRIEQRKKIAEAVDGNPALAILGQSGIGKTVLLKQCAVGWNLTARVIWVDAPLLATIELDEFEKRIGLHHSLNELLSTVSDRRVIFVFDAIDRLVSQSSFAQLSAIVRASCDSRSHSFRVVVTCQSEEWERVCAGLTRAACPIDDWEQLAIQQPTVAELQPIWEAFPALLLLATRPHLAEIIRMPRILDVLASRLSGGEAVNADDWVGESSLISWYWESEVKSHEAGKERSAFLQRLGIRQADDGVPDTPLIDLTDGSQYLRELVERRICVERMERVSFYHDSTGDWARQRAILAAERDLNGFLANRTSRPQWHRAIRLYAIHLLETLADASEWIGLIERIPTITDFLLDAVVFAANPTRLLENVWPALVRNDGELLRRFLKRFRHVASQPNRRLMQALANNGEASPFLRTIDRDPCSYWPSWVATLKFLRSHVEELRTMAAIESANLAQTWLSMTPLDWPERLTAAEIALCIAEDTHRSRLGCRYSEDKNASSCYVAALATAHELPDRLVSLLRHACSLIAVDIEENDDGSLESTDPYSMKKRQRTRMWKQVQHESWPDGPLCDVDVALRDACISGSALDPLMEINPTFSRKLILALLIEVRSARTHYDRMSVVDDDVGVERLRQFQIPFYVHGPFLRFLQISPEDGMLTIIRLVNHATDRWCELTKQQSNHVINKNGLQAFDQEPRLHGEFECFHWNRGEANGNGAVVSALMALEKWLSAHFEKSESISNRVKFILEHSTSVATIGMLADLGRRLPELFLEELQPILAVPEFYVFDTLYIRSGFAPRGMDVDTRYTEEYFNEHHSWLCAPFRKRPLIEIAMSLFGKYSKFREFILSAREKWLERLNNDVQDNLCVSLENLFQLFSPDSWITRTAEDGSTELIFKRNNELDEDPVLDESCDDDPRAECDAFVRDCVNSISESKQFDASELEGIWRFCLEIEGNVLADGSDLGPWVLHAEAAAAALLMSLHCDWLKQFSDRMAWCEERMHRLTVESFEDADSEGLNPYTTHFLAMHVANLVPRLWANAPLERHYREWVAILATRFGTGVTSALLKSASEVRINLGASFCQLVHFVLRFSAAHWELSSEISQMKRKTAFDLEGWSETESIAFIDGTVPSHFPEFSSTWLSEPQIWWARHCGHNDEAYRRVPPMTLTLVEVSLSWIPPLADAVSREERRSWVFLWKEAVTLSTSLAQLCDREGNPLSLQDAYGGLPFNFEEWLFEKIANVVLESNDLDEVRPLWQPIMALGRQFGWWVRHFLHPLFRKGLESHELSKFPVLWREMAQFALQTDSWVKYEEWGRMRGQDLWCELLGVDDSSQFFWKPEHEPLVKLAIDWYEPIAKQVLARRDTAVHLIRWLRLPAAAPIRDRSLAWIFETVMRHPSWMNNETPVQNEIACLLDHCWRAGDLTMEPSSEATFRELVRLLSEHQNTLAMDLEDRIARGIMY